MAFMAGGCGTQTFMVYKDGMNFFITSNCPERQRLLCDSGDIDRVVACSNLPTSLQLRIKEAICSKDKTKQDMSDLLGEMTDEQRSSLKNAFRIIGYEINKPADT